MRLLISLLLMLGISGLSHADPQTLVPDELQLEDADTLLVLIGDIRYRVQLPAIDAPESVANPKLQRDRQRTGLSEAQLLQLGAGAEAGLQRLLQAFSPYRLQIDPGARDKYGRSPGDLLDAQGRRLSVRLVAEGYAVPLGRGKSTVPPALEQALQQAKQGRQGLWGSQPDVFAAWAGSTARPR